LFALFFLSIEIASNIEGEQESELLAEYDAFNKRQQQKMFNNNSRQSINTLSSPNKRRNV
jgi:hypothetical protein